MFTRLDYSSALKYSIIRRYTNIVLYIINNQQRNNKHFHFYDILISILGLQTTQHTSGGAVIAFTNCCASCVETSRPQQCGSDLLFWGGGGASRPCGLAGWLVLLLIKAGDVETSPCLTPTHKQVWICDICHKQIHCMKQISIRCNRNEHCVPKMPRYPPSSQTDQRRSHDYRHNTRTQQ